MWFSRFPNLPGSAEAQGTEGGIVKRLLIAYYIGNISAKKLSKSIHVCQSYSKPKVGRFLRHGVVVTSCLTSYKNLITCTIGVVLLALRSCGKLRHIAPKPTQHAARLRIRCSCSFNLLFSSFTDFTIHTQLLGQVYSFKRSFCSFSFNRTHAIQNCFTTSSAVKCLRQNHA